MSPVEFNRFCATVKGIFTPDWHGLIGLARELARYLDAASGALKRWAERVDEELDNEYAN